MMSLDGIVGKYARELAEKQVESNGTAIFFNEELLRMAEELSARWCRVHDEQMSLKDNPLIRKGLVSYNFFFDTGLCAFESRRNDGAGWDLSDNVTLGRFFSLCAAYGDVVYTDVELDDDGDRYEIVAYVYPRNFEVLQQTYSADIKIHPKGIYLPPPIES